MASWFAAAPSAWFGDDGTLAEARASATAVGQPDRCDILAFLTVRNSRGNVVNETEVVREEDVPCRLQKFDVLVAGTESGGVFGRAGDLVDTSAQAYQLFLPWGTDIRPSDRVRMASGARFEVNGVDADSTFGVEVTARLVRLGLDNPEAD
jgi:hypothetical protein